MAQQHLDFGTAAANDGEYLRTAFPKIDDNFNDLYGVQGLVADDSSASVKTANTAAIQAAVDDAYDSGVQVVQLPNGVYYCDPGIYLDAPGNLRSSLTVPSIFDFSLHLRGTGGLYNHSGYGTQLQFTDNTLPALIIGTGQGMRVSDLSIIGPSSASRASLPSDGIGVALAGGSAGLSRCLLDNVGVRRFRTGYKTGFNANDLCDSVTLNKCVAFDCYTGIHISQTQNYINNLFACDFGGNKIHVLSDVAKAVNIWGGNYSTSDAKNALFSASSVVLGGSFVDPNDGAINHTVDIVLSSPDAFVAYGDYDAWVIDTSSFGPVPLEFVSWNAGTSTVTLKFQHYWIVSRSVFSFPFSLLEPEIEAATQVYACERIIPFKGLCLKVEGVHVENPKSVTTLIDQTSSFGGDNASKLDRITLNYNTTMSDYSGTPGIAAYGVWLAQQTFPFIAMALPDDCRVKISHIVNVANPDPLLVDMYLSDHRGSRLIVEDCNLRLAFRSQNFGGFFRPEHYGATIESDSWDQFKPTLNGLVPWYQQGESMAVPFTGYLPAPHAVLRLQPSELALVESPGTIGDYPPIMGRRLYQVDASLSGLAGGSFEASASRLIESDHPLFSWGQNVTADWEYVAGTNVVRVSSGIDMLFSGLTVYFSGVDTRRYIITGVFVTLGLITVSGLDGNLLAGTAGNTYSGSSIDQEPYVFRRISGLPTTKNVTNSTSGAQTAAVGDLTGAHIVNLLLTGIGAANFTTRTATEMFGDIPGAYVGLEYEITIRNTNAGTTTLNAGSGITVSGTASIDQNIKRRFSVEFTAVDACTITNLEAVTTV